MSQNNRQKKKKNSKHIGIEIETKFEEHKIRKVQQNSTHRIEIENKICRTKNQKSTANSTLRERRGRET